MRKEKFYKTLLTIIFIFLGFYYLNNQVAFNTYWGYDGGGHLEYIKTLFYENTLPSFADNYLAWHEPFYYISMTIVAKVIHIFNFFDYDFLLFEIKFLQFFSTAILLGSLYLLYKITKFFTKDRFTQSLVVFFAGTLSVFLETANYLTNETLSCFFALLIFYNLLVIDREGWTIKRSLFFGLLLGLALLTKLSALIIVLAFTIYFIYKTLFYKKYQNFKYLIIALVLAFLIYSPWLFYKARFIGNIWTINSYEDQMEEREDRRLGSFFFIKPGIKDILSNPFWMSSRDSFWGMLVADTFSDYYTIAGNVDHNNELPPGTKILTDSGRYVTPFKFTLSIFHLSFVWVWLILFVATLVFLIVRWIKLRFKPDAFLIVLITVFGYFSALMFNVARYPYLERGTLKASFIMPAWFILITLSFIFLEYLIKKYKVKYLWVPIILVYILTTFSMLVIDFIVF